MTGGPIRPLPFAANLARIAEVPVKRVAIPRVVGWLVSMRRKFCSAQRESEFIHFHAAPVMLCVSSGLFEDFASVIAYITAI
jgi:hypothetical protein